MSQLGVFDPFYNPFGTPPNPLQTGAEAFAQATEMAPTYGAGGATQLYEPGNEELYYPSALEEEIPPYEQSGYTVPEITPNEELYYPAAVEEEIPSYETTAYDTWSEAQPIADVVQYPQEQYDYTAPENYNYVPEYDYNEYYDPTQYWPEEDVAPNNYWEWTPDTSYEDDTNWVDDSIYNFESGLADAEAATAEPTMMEKYWTKRQEEIDRFHERERQDALAAAQAEYDRQEFYQNMLEMSPEARAEWWTNYIHSDDFQSQYPDVSVDDISFNQAGMPEIWRTAVPKTGPTLGELQAKRDAAEASLNAAEVSWNKAMAQGDEEARAKAEASLANARAALTNAENDAMAIRADERVAGLDTESLLREYMGLQQSAKAKMGMAKQLRENQGWQEETYQTGTTRRGAAITQKEWHRDPERAAKEQMRAFNLEQQAAKELSKLPELLDAYKNARKLDQENVFLKTAGEIQTMITARDRARGLQYRAEQNVKKVIEDTRGMDPRGPDSHANLASRAMLEFKNARGRSPADWESGELQEAIAYTKQRIANDPATQKWWDYNNSKLELVQQDQHNLRMASMYNGIAGGLWGIVEYAKRAPFGGLPLAGLRWASGFDDYDLAYRNEQVRQSIVDEHNQREIRQAALEGRTPNTIKTDGDPGSATAMLAGYLSGLAADPKKLEEMVDREFSNAHTEGMKMLSIDKSKMRDYELAAWEGGELIGRSIAEAFVGAKAGGAMKGALEASMANKVAGLRAGVVSAEAAQFAAVQRAGVTAGEIAAADQALAKALAAAAKAPTKIPWVAEAAVYSAADAATFIQGEYLAGERDVNTLVNNAMYGALLGGAFGGVAHMAGRMGIPEAWVSNKIADAASATRAAAIRASGKWLGEGAENLARRFLGETAGAIPLPPELLRINERITQKSVRVIAEELKQRTAAGVVPAETRAGVARATLADVGEAARIEGMEQALTPDWLQKQRPLVREIAFQDLGNLDEATMRRFAGHMSVENAATAPLSEVHNALADKWSKGVWARDILGELSSGSLKEILVRKGLAEASELRGVKKKKLIKALEANLSTDDIVQIVADEYNPLVVANAFKKAAINMVDVASRTDKKAAQLVKTLEMENKLLDMRATALTNAGKRQDMFYAPRAVAKYYIGNGEDYFDLVTDRHGNPIAAAQKVKKGLLDFIFVSDSVLGENLITFQEKAGKLTSEELTHVFEYQNGNRSVVLTPKESQYREAALEALENTRKRAVKAGVRVVTYDAAGKKHYSPMPESSEFYITHTLKGEITEAVRAGREELVEYWANKMFTHPEFGKSFNSVQEAEVFIRTQAMQGGVIGEGIMGRIGFHKREFHNIPTEFLETDVDRLMQRYMSNASQQIAAHEVFGGAGQPFLKGWMAEIESQTKGVQGVDGAAQYIQRNMIEPMFNGANPYIGDKWVNAMTQYEAVTKIFLNLGLIGRQSVQPFLANVRHTTVRRAAIEMGATTPKILRRLLTGEPDPQTTLMILSGCMNGTMSFIHDPVFYKMITGTGISSKFAVGRAVGRFAEGTARVFQTADSLARGVSATCGLHYAEDCIRYMMDEGSLLKRTFNRLVKGRVPVFDTKLGKSRISRSLNEVFGIGPEKLEEIMARKGADGKWLGFTHDEQIRLMHDYARTTNFARDPLSMPPWMQNHPAMRAATLFMSFGYQQSRQTAGALAAVYRNPHDALFQITSMTGGAIVAGEFEAWMQWLLQGKERQEEMNSSGIAARILDDIFMSGQLGLLQNYAQSIWQTGWKQGLKQSWAPVWLSDIGNHLAVVSSLYDKAIGEGTMADVAKAASGIFPGLKPVAYAVKGRDQTNYETLLAHIAHAGRVGKADTWLKRMRAQGMSSIALQDSDLYEAYKTGNADVVMEWLDNHMRTSKNDLKQVTNAMMTSIRNNDPRYRMDQSNFYDMDSMFSGNPQLVKYIPGAIAVHQDMTKFLTGAYYKWLADPERATKYGFDLRDVMYNQEQQSQFFQKTLPKAAPFEKSKFWPTGPKELRVFYNQYVQWHTPINQMREQFAVNPALVEAMVAFYDKYGNYSPDQIKQLLREPRMMAPKAKPEEPTQINFR